MTFIEEGAEDVFCQALQSMGYTVSGTKVLIVECPWADVSRIASFIVDVPYVTYSPECPVETKNALYAYWSRKSRPEWHANEDWFQAHKDEFKAGECVVIQRGALQLRTRDIRECLIYLHDHGDEHTVMHEMVGDGVESVDRL